MTIIKCQRRRDTEIKLLGTKQTLRETKLAYRSQDSDRMSPFDPCLAVLLPDIYSTVVRAAVNRTV